MKSIDWEKEYYKEKVRRLELDLKLLRSRETRPANLTFEEFDELYKRNFESWKQKAKERNIKDSDVEIVLPSGRFMVKRRKAVKVLYEIVHAHPSSMFPPKAFYVLKPGLTKPKSISKNDWKVLIEKGYV